MSNYSRTGKREQLRVDKRDVKKRMKRVYEIMEILDGVAGNMYKPEIEYTEENIEEYARPYTDLTLEGLEKFLLLGKLHTIKDNESKTEDNIK
jgi:hypothetical protein